MRKMVSFLTLITTILVSVMPVTASATAVDEVLTERLKGYTLLSVDSRGELYYVNPDSGIAKYLGTYQQTWEVIKSEMIGITDADLARVESDSVLRERLMGRFLLAVENHGEVYYLRPSDEKLHYLGTGASTFDKLKFLALGVNQENLSKLQLDLTGTEVPAPQETPEPTPEPTPVPVPSTYTDGQMAVDFMQVFTSGYEEFKKEYSFYPEIQYFESLFTWNQPIYLTETGFSLAPGGRTFFVWGKVDAEFKDFYYNHLEKEMTLYTYTFAFDIPNTVTTEMGVLTPGMYYYTHGEGFLTQEQYTNLQEVGEPVENEERSANEEAERIIEAVRMIQEGLEDYKTADRWYPLTGNEPIPLGENGATKLSQENHFWGQPGDKGVFIDFIPSGQPSTHLMYFAPAWGQPYSLTFELHGYYDGFTPGKYVTNTPGKIQRIGDLD